MTLILSCIAKGEDQTRRTLDALVQAGIAHHDIIIVHPGDPVGHPQRRSLTQGETAAEAEPPPPSTAGAAASGSAAGGVFGWLVGYGVLSIPGAILGGAVGAVAGAAIGATRQALARHLPDEVQHHYASRIVDDHAAILVKIGNRGQYDTVLTVFLDHDCRHILTSRNSPAAVESDQLAAITQEASQHDDDSSDDRLVAGSSD